MALISCMESRSRIGESCVPSDILTPPSCRATKSDVSSSEAWKESSKRRGEEKAAHMGEQPKVARDSGFCTGDDWRKLRTEKPRLVALQIIFEARHGTHQRCFEGFAQKRKLSGWVGGAQVVRVSGGSAGRLGEATLEGEARSVASQILCSLQCLDRILFV